MLIPTRVDEVRAELVGHVLNVLVAEGSPVTSGDTIVVLESMKMEIPVLTEMDGVVRRITVCMGDVVQRGDLLALLADSSQEGRPTTDASERDVAVDASTCRCLGQRPQ